MKTRFQSHDLTLPPWGPYFKQYSGISHVPAANDGVRFDLSVFPGLYRRKVDVPAARFESGILCSWDYFYNSGGWDDYPPQVAVHRMHLEDSCAPVITTAQAICCARILAYTARLLGKEEDAAGFESDIARFAAALQACAWDEESGCFGYVRHDSRGEAAGILRCSSGENYNLGLDGASPLYAGVCTPAQERRLWERLEDEAHLWSSCGLSTVDRSAPYYRPDGYWNGAVWMPHQWFYFKAALDAGKTDFAWRIAETALQLWQDECQTSYHCFEHFMIQTRRGAGWHQFGGLSAPVSLWFASYFVPGTVTTGLQTYVVSHSGSTVRLALTRPGPASVLIALEPGKRRIQASLPPETVFQRHSGLWELTFRPETPCGITVTLDPC